MRKRKNYKLVNMIDQKGSSLLQVADLLGVTYPTIMSRINCRSEFKASEIAKIKKAFNLSMAEVEELFLKAQK